MHLFFQNFRGSMPPDPPSKQRVRHWLALQDAGASLVRPQHPLLLFPGYAPAMHGTKSDVLIVIALYYIAVQVFVKDQLVCYTINHCKRYFFSLQNTVSKSPTMQENASICSIILGRHVPDSSGLSWNGPHFKSNDPPPQELGWVRACYDSWVII